MYVKKAIAIGTRLRQVQSYNLKDKVASLQQEKTIRIKFPIKQIKSKTKTHIKSIYLLNDY